MRGEEDQVLGGWQGVIHWGYSLTKTGLVESNKREGIKLDIRTLGTRWVGESEKLVSEQLRGVINRVLSVARSEGCSNLTTTAQRRGSA